MFYGVATEQAIRVISCSWLKGEWTSSFHMNVRGTPARRTLGTLDSQLLSCMHRWGRQQDFQTSEEKGEGEYGWDEDDMYGETKVS